MIKKIIFVFVILLDGFLLLVVPILQFADSRIIFIIVSAFLLFLLWRILFGKGTAVEKNPKKPLIIEDILVKETEKIIYEQEVPIDNRYGNSKVVSQHELSHSASTILDFTDTASSASDLQVGALNSIRTEFSDMLIKTIGVHIGSEIQNKATVTFEVPPEKFICYRIIWKQAVREGIIKVNFNKVIYQIPYSVTYGLSHQVESKV